jgi:hypothetical protein
MDSRAISSAGRAPSRQGGGRWFEPSIAHTTALQRIQLARRSILRDALRPKAWRRRAREETGEGVRAVTLLRRALRVCLPLPVNACQPIRCESLRPLEFAPESSPSASVAITGQSACGRLYAPTSNTAVTLLCRRDRRRPLPDGARRRHRGGPSSARPRLSKLVAVADAELLHGAVEVRLDCSYGQHEALGDVTRRTVLARAVPTARRLPPRRKANPALHLRRRRKPSLRATGIRSTRRPNLRLARRPPRLTTVRNAYPARSPQIARRLALTRARFLPSVASMATAGRELAPYPA